MVRVLNIAAACQKLLDDTGWTHATAYQRIGVSSHTWYRWLSTEQDDEVRTHDHFVEALKDAYKKHTKKDLSVEADLQVFTT